ncbi:MAG: hypothetical protein ACKOA1_05090 [Bacteroidota bacterium]
MRRNKLSLKIASFLMLVLLNVVSQKAIGGNGSASNQTGFWGNPSSWLFNGVPRTPNCGDTVTIQSGYNITVSTQQTYTCGSPLYIFISGTLTFTNGNKLSLPCGSIVTVNPGGMIVPSNGGGNSTLIEICNNVQWTSGGGSLPGPATLQYSPLPIELIHFSATPMEPNVDLEWSTATELNNDYFTLERSMNNAEWSVVGNVRGAGNSTTTVEYSFVDQQPLSGISYYRLKQTDFDGTFTYSDPVAVNISRTVKNTLVSVYMSEGNARVNYMAAEEGNADVVICNTSGSEEFRATVQLEKGTNSLLISTPFLVSGLHFITVEFGQDRQSTKTGLY